MSQEKNSSAGDRSDKRASWFGLDLVPLPYESLYSALSRLAWRNVTRFTEIYTLLMGYRMSGRKVSMNGKLWNEPGIIPRSFNWHIDGIGLQLISAFGGAEELFLAKRLRICPICFEHGYHSPFHQLLILRSCPIHDCMLTENCLSCGHELPLFMLSKESIDRPYICNKCNGWFCGVEVTVSNNIEIRMHTEQIVRSFAILKEWLDIAVIVYPRLLRKAMLTDRKLNLKNCANQGIELSDFCQGILPCPIYSREYPTVLTILSWKIRRALFATYKPYANERIWYAKMYVPVYISTFTLIENWLLEILNDRESRMTLSGLTSQIPVHGWHFAHLAYLLCRSHFERHIELRLRTPFDFDPYGCKIRRDSNQVFGIAGRQLRIYWRAMFFGYYSSVYHRLVDFVHKNPNSKAIKFDFTDFFEASYSDNFMSNHGDITGYVAFREVPGMPLAPFGLKEKNIHRLRVGVESEAVQFVDGFMNETFM